MSSEKTVGGDECVRRAPALRPKAVRAFAPIFKALADETRLEMLALLGASGGPLCVCDFEARFDLGQPTVSHHLKVLREAGLVTALRRGSWVHYALSDETVNRIAEFHSLISSGSSPEPEVASTPKPTSKPPSRSVLDDRPVRIRTAR